MRRDVPRRDNGQKRDKGSKVSIIYNDSLALFRFFSEDVTVQAAAGVLHVFRGSLQLPLDHRWYEGKSIDLAVGVMEGDSHCVAFVFEDENILHGRVIAQLHIAICPNLD